MAEQQSVEGSQGQGAGKALKRRGILAAAGAVVAGIAAKRAASPAAALTDTVFVANGSATNFLAAGSGSSGFGTLGTFDTGVVATGTFEGIHGYSPTGTGVIGLTSGDGFSKAVYGKHYGNGYGVYGEATTTNGYGVQGTITNGSAGGRGVSGYAGLGTGVYGSSNGGNGVYGLASAAGTTQVTAGVFGDSTASYGIIGRTTAAGYSGLTAITNTAGVAALAATSTNASAYAAYFTGSTVVQGNFVAFGGSKSAAVKDASGQHRLVYCVESPEAWFEDFGKAKLVNGRADVRLDPDFAAIVHADDYHVFLTAYGNTNGLHVTRQEAGGFTVEEHNGGTGGVTFSYRVVAKRKDIAGERLAKFSPPKINHPDPDKLPKPEHPDPDKLPKPEPIPPSPPPRKP